MNTLNAEKFGCMCGWGWECGVVLLSCLMSLYKAPLVCGSDYKYWVPAYFLVSWFLLQTFFFFTSHPPFPPTLSVPPYPPTSLSPPCGTPTPCHCLTLHPFTYGQCIILCKYSITIDTCCMHICNVMVGFLKPFVFGKSL